MPDLRVLLTFDDGPAPPRTKKILDILAVGNGGSPIIAAFFVQTLACVTIRKKRAPFRDCSAYSLAKPLKPFRMSTPKGTAVVRQAYQAGHVIGIHTGSLLDHLPHPCRAVASPDPITPLLAPVPANGLESDLIRASHDISLLAEAPEFVRATGLYFGTPEESALVHVAYQRLHLRHVGVNVDSLDADITGKVVAEFPRMVPSKRREKIRDRVNAQLRTAIRVALQQNYAPLIVLFHDINPVTVLFLAQYIDAITRAVSELSSKTLTAKFPASRAEAEGILHSSLIVQ